MTTLDFSINFEYRKTSGGYVIKKTVRRDGTEEQHDMFIPQAIADEFVSFYNENNFLQTEDTPF